MRAEPQRHAPPVPRWFWFASGAYAAVYCLLDYLRFRNYDTGSDFGVYMQSVADPSGLMRNVEGSHFLSHFSPMYDLVMPLVVLTGGASCLPLLAFQALSGAAVAVGLLFVARAVLPAPLAVRVAALALVYPPLAGVIFGDPNENFLAPAATVWLFAFVLERKWLWACAAALLALAVKEDQGVLLAWDGLLAGVWAYRRRDPALLRFAAGIVVLGCATLAVYLLVVRPAAGGHAGWVALDRALAAAPDDRSGGRSILARLGYVAEILVPLAFLPLAGWRMLAFALPALAEVLLSRNSAVWTMGQHYAGVWIGYVLVAAAFGTLALYRRSPALAGRVVTAALALSLADLVFASPTHWRIHLHPMTAHDHVLDRVLATLPRDGSLGTHDELYAHLWSLPQLRYQLDSSPRYALVDTTMRTSSSARTMLAQIRSNALGRYRVVRETDGVRLYERTRFPRAPSSATK